MIFEGSVSKKAITYNFIPHEVNLIGHGIIDVLPWIRWGYNSKDSTTFYDRFLLWLGV